MLREARLYDLVCSQYPGCFALALARLLVFVSPFCNVLQTCAAIVNTLTMCSVDLPRTMCCLFSLVGTQKLLVSRSFFMHVVCAADVLGQPSYFYSTLFFVVPLCTWPKLSCLPYGKDDEYFRWSSFLVDVVPISAVAAGPCPCPFWCRFFFEVTLLSYGKGDGYPLLEVAGWCPFCGCKFLFLEALYSSLLLPCSWCLCPER